MNSADIIAWTCDGAAFCADCKPKGDADEVAPVFADNADECNGWTCDACSSCLVDGSWLAHDDAVGPSVRWARCPLCNSQQPHERPTYRRLRTMRDGYRCPNCRRGLMRWI